MHYFVISYCHWPLINTQTQTVQSLGLNSVTITVNVLDVNDNSPQFQTFTTLAGKHKLASCVAIWCVFWQQYRCGGAGWVWEYNYDSCCKFSCTYKLFTWERKCQNHNTHLLAVDLMRIDAHKLFIVNLYAYMCVYIVHVQVPLWASGWKLIAILFQTSPYSLVYMYIFKQC